ncbi:hypothetical protein A0128_14320 [Leptospira tipperaryensis]|uniref:Uncharacterized protein n=1 Tax=Leptospira tipperaryensis TaxID=2564040 RepID=A0A1D7UZA9_9LEPT|nr:hypothetical protein A0128_14320 [Leptospira tipperaryensis]
MRSILKTESSLSTSRRDKPNLDKNLDQRILRFYFVKIDLTPSDVFLRNKFEGVSIRFIFLESTM